MDVCVFFYLCTFHFQQDSEEKKKTIRNLISCTQNSSRVVSWNRDVKQCGKGHQSLVFTSTFTKIPNGHSYIKYIMAVCCWKILRVGQPAKKNIVVIWNTFLESSLHCSQWNIIFCALFAFLCTHNTHWIESRVITLERKCGWFPSLSF